MVDNEGFLSKISEGEVKISSFFLSSSPPNNLSFSLKVSFNTLTAFAMWAGARLECRMGHTPKIYDLRASTQLSGQHLPLLNEKQMYAWDHENENPLYQLFYILNESFSWRHHISYQLRDNKKHEERQDFYL